jgi:respiratory nitrate reductase gamma subunit
MNAFNTFLFVGFPYAAVIVFAVAVTYRYRQAGFTVSSLSSQFLEGRSLFWGSVPFHIGIIVVFLGHMTAFLLPQATLAWNQIPVRLIILEVTAFIFGFTVLVGLTALMFRRFTNARIRAVTTRMDVALEILGQPPEHRRILEVQLTRATIERQLKVRESEHEARSPTVTGDAFAGGGYVVLRVAGV